MTTAKLEASPRCVTGMPASAGAAIADDTPGTISNGMPAARQRERLFAAAPEHERVAALEAHDAQPAPRVLDEQAVEHVLLDRLPAGALADVEPARARRERAHLLGRRARRRAPDRPRPAGARRAR